jgi:hypothetical protein
MVSQFRGKASTYINTGSHGHLVLPGQMGAFTQKVINGWRAFELAHERMLVPTPYFFEALHYASKAKKLQTASLAGKRVPKVGDPLMEAIPIYNTVERRYAGFSNVPELLWYGHDAPKGRQCEERLPKIFKPWKVRVAMAHARGGDQQLSDWLFITLAHRITGSGASFEADHGFRNSRIIEMQERVSSSMMGLWLSSYDGPIFTSIGNQIPPFPKIGGRAYLRDIAPDLVMMVTAMLITWKSQRPDPMPIKTCVDMVLKAHTALGCKQFKFVLTAWVMDMAEYLPEYVDPNSDCYHGKNAIESMNICFDRLPSMKLQDFYDTATRLFADVTGTKPMDVEDASPGCDLVRWIENYVPKKGFDHVHAGGIFNGSSLRWANGRQPT